MMNCEGDFQVGKIFGRAPETWVLRGGIVYLLFEGVYLPEVFWSFQVVFTHVVWINFGCGHVRIILQIHRRSISTRWWLFNHF